MAKDSATIRAKVSPKSLRGRMSFLANRLRYYFEVIGSLHDCAYDIKGGIEALVNETAKAHLAKIGTGVPLDPSELSYGLSFAVRLLAPEIQRHGSNRDVAICSVATGEAYRERVGKCLKTHESYCRARGYDYIQQLATPLGLNRAPSWYKIPLVFKALQLGYKHVFFIDADAMVTNESICVEACVNKLKDKGLFYVAEDEGGINCGVFLLKSDPDAFRLLDLIWLNDQGPHRLWEQAALVSLLNRHRQVRDLVTVAESAKDINSFPPERGEFYRKEQINTWTPGDFICHFAGLRDEVLVSLIDDYQKKMGKQA